MKKTFVDPETGWIVTQEACAKRGAGCETVEETITHPKTGETHHRSRLASFHSCVRTWLAEIARHSAMRNELERQRRHRLGELYPELAAGAKVPAGELGLIKLRFAEAFAFWNIILPEDAVVHRRRGRIRQRGWIIWYLFGSDEQVEYLDYYAAHRMTDDGHFRIYADGRSALLPAIQSGRRASSDLDEDAWLEGEYFAHNRAVAELLETKGFILRGDEPAGVRINRYLRLNRVD